MEQKDEIIGYFIEQSPNEKLLNLHVNEELGALSTSSESKLWVAPTPNSVTKANIYSTQEIVKAENTKLQNNRLLR